MHHAIHYSLLLLLQQKTEGKNKTFVSEEETNGREHKKHSGVLCRYKKS